MHALKDGRLDNLVARNVSSVKEFVEMKHNTQLKQKHSIILNTVTLNKIICLQLITLDRINILPSKVFFCGNSEDLSSLLLTEEWAEQ